jgi:hypothetical protein
MVSQLLKKLPTFVEPKIVLPISPLDPTPIQFNAAYTLAAILFEIQFNPVQICTVVFEVLTALVMKISVFCDTSPRSPLRINRRFGKTCRLHLQKETSMKQAENSTLLRWKRHVPQKRRLILNGLLGDTSQKTELF